MGKKLLILGAGGHGKVVCETALAMKENEVRIYSTIDFLDDQAPEAVGEIHELSKFCELYDEVFCGIGNNSVRKLILEKVAQLGCRIPVLIHPTAYVSPTATIEEGTIIEPKAIVNANSTVKKGCIISVGAIVDHDVEVENYAHINAGAICKAGSQIETIRKLEAGEVILGYEVARVKR